MKYYVVSDVHGFYTPMKKALKDAGFFDEQEECKLIICGDLLDRGGEAKQVIDFALQMMKENKLIYVLGNHEELLVQCLQDIAAKGTQKIVLGMSAHVRNKTWDSLLQISSMSEMEAYNNGDELVRRVMSSSFYKKLLPTCVDYFETEHYIFTHGYIPFFAESYRPLIKCKFNPNWRYAGVDEWRVARWVNGMEAACRHKMTVKGKTVVCGHWHTSYGHSNISKKGTEFGKTAILTPFYAKGIIAIDGCTVSSGMVNCIVIED